MRSGPRGPAFTRSSISFLSVAIHSSTLSTLNCSPPTEATIMSFGASSSLGVSVQVNLKGCAVGVHLSFGSHASGSTDALGAGVSEATLADAEGGAGALLDGPADEVE